MENTAACNYWMRKYPFGKGEPQPALCSLCDPKIGKWHGIFKRSPAKGYLVGEDGFLYPKERVEAGQVTHTKIVGEVLE